MKSIVVKDLMVPLKDYATVPREATLREAVFALEKAQMTLDPSRHKHRAILVLDKNGKVVSKITMKDIMTKVAGEPWAIGMAVALASSYAHFLIVGSPANALTFALGVYPDSNKRVLEAIDFVKYGFGFFILSMLLLWLVEFLVVYPIVGFPEGILEHASQILQSAAAK